MPWHREIYVAYPVPSDRSPSSDSRGNTTIEWSGCLGLMERYHHLDTAKSIREILSPLFHDFLTGFYPKVLQGLFHEPDSSRKSMR